MDFVGTKEVEAIFAGAGITITDPDMLASLIVETLMVSRIGALEPLLTVAKENLYKQSAEFIKNNECDETKITVFYNEPYPGSSCYDCLYVVESWGTISRAIGKVIKLRTFL